MILVILAISIILLVVGLFLYSNYYSRYNHNVHEEVGFCMAVIGAVITIVALIATLILGVKCSQLKVIDNKIKMYESENQKIETQIETTVAAYQKHEKDIFANVKGESAIILVSLYPELKSDELVKKQIETYTSNNEKIKTLKEEKINGSILRWWLYFGQDTTK
jgi:heme/copper-type cytochrome/quinol oxidase subunit 2